MSDRIIDLQDSFYNPILETTTKGFVDAANSDLASLRSNYSQKFKITQKYAYRPDLIALSFLGDSSLAWQITYANDFQEGLKEYYVGRIIKIPYAI